MTRTTKQFMPYVFHINPVEQGFYYFAVLREDDVEQVVVYFREKDFDLPIELKGRVGGKVTIAGFLKDKAELKHQYQAFEVGSRKMRGKWQAFAMTFVDAYRQLPDSVK